MLVKSCRDGSILLLNSNCKNLEDVNNAMPQSMREMISKKKLRLMLMDASEISMNVGLPGRINSAMQTAFFMLSGVLPQEKAIQIWRKTIEKTFKKKGAEVINKNLAQVDETLKPGAVFELKYPDNWGSIEEGAEPLNFNKRTELALKNAPDFIRNVFMPTVLG